MDEGYHCQRYGERSRQRLDMALINFFQCFRKVYIGEQVGPRRSGEGHGWACRDMQGIALAPALSSLYFAILPLRLLAN